MCLLLLFDVQLVTYIEQNSQILIQTVMFTNAMYTVKPNESEVTVKARCYRSMKKNEQPYLLKIIIFRKQDQPDVVSFSCSCAAGKGFCHPIAGLLFQLSHFKMLGLNAIPPVLSKTSKPQVFFSASCSSIIVAVTKDFIYMILHLFGRN